MEKQKITNLKKNFREINSQLFVKRVDFTEFSLKECESKLFKFPHWIWEMCRTCFTENQLITN